ncbi:hypothetical protein LXL04_004260 [Taraxacum kok-saghyz]
MEREFMESQQTFKKKTDLDMIKTDMEILKMKAEDCEGEDLEIFRALKESVRAKYQRQIYPTPKSPLSGIEPITSLLVNHHNSEIEFIFKSLKGIVVKLVRVTSRVISNLERVDSDCDSFFSVTRSKIVSRYSTRTESSQLVTLTSQMFFGLPAKPSPSGISHWRGDTMAILNAIWSRITIFPHHNHLEDCDIVRRFTDRAIIFV